MRALRLAGHTRNMNNSMSSPSVSRPVSAGGRRRTAVLAGIGAALVVGALAGCSAISASMTDAWSITYRVSLDGADTEALAAVEVADGEKRGESSRMITVSGEELRVSSPGEWSRDAIVNAGDRAAIVATPGAQSTATCEILIDGSRSLQKTTGNPGEAVTCEVDTPAFEKK